MQAVPGQQQAESALSNIAEYGILGSFCVLFIVAVVLAIRGWLKEKDGRLADQKAMASELKEVNELLKNLTVELKASSTQLGAEVKLSQEVMTSALNRQEDALEDLGRAFSSLKDGNVELRSSVDKLREEQARLAAAVSKS